MISENDVIDAIVDILESIEAGDTTLFSEVHDFVPAQFERYPCAYVVPVNWQEDYIDLRDTGVSATFRVGIIYTLEPDSEAGQKAIRDAATLVRDELKKQENIQLGGTVDWSQLTSGNFSYDTRDQKIALCEIDLSVRKRYSRY